VPVTLPEQPLNNCAFAKLSLAGGEGVGVGDGGGGGGGQFDTHQPMSLIKENVRSCGGLTL